METEKSNLYSRYKQDAVACKHGYYGYEFWLEKKLIEVESELKKLRVDENLNISDVMFSFSDMIGFTRWILQGDDFGNITRYIYIEPKDYFIDDDGNGYTWEELYKIYLKK